MAEDARELLRLAQEAERSGDLGMAEALLERAAAAADLEGRGDRAAQLRRHARRLSEQLPGEPGRKLVDRVPVLADPAVAAWCSFCCRPDDLPFPVSNGLLDNSGLPLAFPHP